MEITIEVCRILGNRSIFHEGRRNDAIFMDQVHEHRPMPTVFYRTIEEEANLTVV